jgi:Na+/proline symporter
MKNESSRHSLDVRVTLPLYFATYYLVIFAGRDQRQSTYDTKHTRNNRKASIKNILLFLVLTFFAALFWIALIAALYWLKREMGIDLFPNHHLSDIFS